MAEPTPVKRRVATEIAPGFVAIADAADPTLPPLLLGARRHSQAAFIGIAGLPVPADARLRRLDLPAILAEPALWTEGALTLGAAKVLFDAFRPIRAATHPPLLGPILAIRALVHGGAAMIAADPPPVETESLEAEARHAARLMVLSTVRRDLLAVPEGTPTQAACAALAAEVAEATLLELKLWSHHRGVLWSRDLRATWAPRPGAAR